MILYEFEGKSLLHHGGIDTPVSQLIDSPETEIIVKAPYVLKAQVLSGKRADVGGIVVVEEETKGQSELRDLFGETINQEKVEKVLVEQKIEFEEQFYVSISYDQDVRGPVLSISSEGGSGIEGRGLELFEIDPLTKSVIASGSEAIPNNLLEIATPSARDDGMGLPSELIEKLIKLFFEQDMILLEVNPLVKSSDGRWIALDAKVKLDDYAKPRHEEWDYPIRSAPGYTPTVREIEAKKIDEGDYRGTAGSAYFDLEGDIGVLSSGGGVSLTALDCLIAIGGKPANFTEYSGNPPKEKVTKLTKIVLSKENIHGLWVIGTVVANFTDIHETLSGLVEGLREAEKELGRKFDFPIVIRRG